MHMSKLCFNNCNLLKTMYKKSKPQYANETLNVLIYLIHLLNYNLPAENLSYSFKCASI
jgi:hypothetical protein